jgi:CRISPR/Cas system-associated exonuclease Cas4 (RecB family)
MGGKKLISASEIGEYVYCRRAWWLHHVAGIEPDNVEELSLGSAAHRAHGKTVRSSQLAGRAAVLLMAIALLLVTIWLLSSGVL